MKKSEEKGITLIALIVMIIILIILAGIVINMAIGNNGIIRRAKEAEFKTMMGEYRDEVDLYVSWQITESMNTDTTNINSGEPLKVAIEQAVTPDIEESDITVSIEEIINAIKEQAKQYVVVYKGEICYVSDNKIPNNAKQEKWCEEIGIKILKIETPEGIEVKNGDYELVKGVYLCTPKLDKGFISDRTRYLDVTESGNLIPGNWIDKKPSENWYDYKNRNWANIIVEDGGTENYYVWIPRYCFKLLPGERTDVKFIDCNNNYKDENGVETLWIGENGLEAMGYQVPEAFTFNGKEIPGYWAMKYTASDITTPTTINYDMSVNKGVITLKNITQNTTITNNNVIVKYTVALNGNVVEQITEVDNIASKQINLTGIKKGNNAINITGLNEAGEVVGSMTKTYAPAIVNKPDTSGFNQDTTFYVTYDDDGKEHSTIPLSSGSVPEYWYDYGESRWANIVTRNDGQETYYTWIPRYSYILDQKNERSTVSFISGTSKEVANGYTIPEAFTFNGKELTGFWAMKYTAGDEYAPKFDTEVVATNNSISTKGITGTMVQTGQKYKYYINGEYKVEKQTAEESFEYDKLSSNQKYTILVEIRDTSDELVGTIVKQISTIDANKPELIGFNKENTYYVLYDDEGNETIGDKIENDASNMPSGWYDYSKSKWANIVVKADGKTTYYTWIPRYEFKITNSQHKQPVSGRTEVRFIEKTSTNVDVGYEIPEAFTFNGKELTGFWAMKYTAGD